MTKNKPNEILEALRKEQFDEDMILDLFYNDINQRHMKGFLLPGSISLICLCLTIFQKELFDFFDFKFNLIFQYSTLSIGLASEGDDKILGQIAIFTFFLILPFLLSMIFSLIIFFKTQSSVNSQNNKQFRGKTKPETLFVTNFLY